MPIIQSGRNVKLRKAGTDAAARGMSCFPLHSGIARKQRRTFTFQIFSNMAIEVKEITTKQVEAILSKREGHFFDGKAIEIKPGKLSETVAAFANTDGGEVLIGIDENRLLWSFTWRGFTNPEAANAHLQVLDRLFPLGQDFHYTFLQAPEATGLLLHIEVRKTREIKKATDGHPYVRRGAQSNRVTSPEGLRQLEYIKGLSSFETETVAVDKSIVTDSIEIFEFMIDVIPTSEPEPWLRKQQIIRGQNPTVAGCLLFADEPQAVLPKRSGIKVYRYNTKDDVGSRETLAFDPITIEGPLYDQIHNAVDTTTRVVQDSRKLGEYNLEEVTYPPEALHEIITNAVLHRDYSVADDVHIRVFDNRVEIESPGRLPAHITVDNILDERFARNGTLVRLLNKYPNPPNKDVGEGLNTAFNAMHKLGLKEPAIEQRANSVLVKIKHESLASPEEVILGYLELNDSIQNKTARELCHVSGDYVVRAVFKRLEARELIERVPGTNTASTAYRKGSKFESQRRKV